MDELAVSVNNITKNFKIDQRKGISKITKEKSPSSLKILTALENISFELKKGEILGILGLNASGKTTLLRVIAGVYKPDFGSVKIYGKLSPLMQLGAGFQGDLNAYENIIMNGMLLGISKSVIKKRVSKILEFSELEKFSNMKLKHFSSGMRSRLAFATAIQVDPDILLVDEILSVGDWTFRKKCYETFLSFKKNNKTILHSTHNLEMLSEFSDKILLLHKGQNIMIGEPKEVIKKFKDIKSIR